MRVDVFQTRAFVFQGSALFCQDLVEFLTFGWFVVFVEGKVVKLFLKNGKHVAKINKQMTARLESHDLEK